MEVWKFYRNTNIWEYVNILDIQGLHNEQRSRNLIKYWYHIYCVITFLWASKTCFLRNFETGCIWILVKWLSKSFLSDFRFASNVGSTCNFLKVWQPARFLFLSVGWSMPLYNRRILGYNFFCFPENLKDKSKIRIPL